MQFDLAYHVVVHAIEGKARIPPIARFALAARHAVDGHLPYSRYFEAGQRRQSQRFSRVDLEGAVGEWLATDLNPAVQAIRCVSSLNDAVAAYNAYNESARLGVRTVAAPTTTLDLEKGRVSATRRRLTGAEDPEACQVATVAVLGHLMRRVAMNAESLSQPNPDRLTHVAHLLGVGASASCDVARVFEAEGTMPVDELAKALHCGRRTLERRLREEGTSAELLRRAARMVRATGRLRSAESLTEIAVAEGFSDLAHMTRSFQAACGMTPTLLRRVLRGAPTNPTAREAS